MIRQRQTCRIAPSHNRDFVYNNVYYFTFLNANANYQYAKFDGNSVSIIDNPENEGYDDSWHQNDWMAWSSQAVYQNQLYSIYSYYLFCSPDGREYWKGYKWARFDSIIPVPTRPSSHLTFRYIEQDRVQVSWHEGNGSSKIVVICKGENHFPVSNGISYSSKSTYGFGSQIGADCYCVYKGLDTITPIITNLTPFTKYTVKVFDFNGAGENTKYNFNDNIGNPDTFRTMKLCPSFDFLGIEKKVGDPDFAPKVKYTFYPMDNNLIDFNLEYVIVDTTIAEIVANNLIHIKKNGITRLIVKNRCLSIDAPFIVKDSIPLMNNNNLKEIYSFKIFPNPTPNIINIESIESIDKLLICNLFGETLYHYQFNKKYAKIDISNYSSGIYIIKIISNKKVYIRNIIKI